MPAPSYSHSSSVHQELARRITRDISPNEIDEILAAIGGLRDEIAQLRRDMLSTPSIILTGRQVTAIYEQLKQNRG